MSSVNEKPVGACVKAVFRLQGQDSQGPIESTNGPSTDPMCDDSSRQGGNAIMRVVYDPPAAGDNNPDIYVGEIHGAGFRREMIAEVDISYAGID
jgi:hypothetical protein